jgi:hypothetical protein
MRAVETALVAALACCISSIGSMARTRRKVGSGSVMEMTVATEENRGSSPRRVLRMRARSLMGDSFSARESAICF